MVDIDTATLRALLAEGLQHHGSAADISLCSQAACVDTALAFCRALPALLDAAEERDMLRARVAELEEALLPFVDHLDDTDTDDAPDTQWSTVRYTWGAMRRARAVLEGVRAVEGAGG